MNEPTTPPPALKIPDPEDSWAQVELYRWQTGDLPPQDGSGPPLDPAKGLRNMAEALFIGTHKSATEEQRKACPDPFNTVSVLRYAAKLLEVKATAKPGRPKVGRNEKCPCGSGHKFKNCCLNAEERGLDVVFSSPQITR